MVLGKAMGEYRAPAWLGEPRWTAASTLPLSKGGWVIFSLLGPWLDNPWVARRGLGEGELRHPGSEVALPSSVVWQTTVVDCWLGGLGQPTFPPLWPDLVHALQQGMH